MKQLSSLEGKPNSSEIAIERSRLYFYLYKASVPSEEKKLIEILENGKSIAEEGLKLSAENPILEFWWTANVGAIAAVKKNLGALKTLFDLEKKLIRFRETHADYGFGAADRVLGSMYAEAPRFISIGSKSKAEECLLRAYEKFPQFPGNVLGLASFYLQQDRRAEAVKLSLKISESSFIEGGDFGIFNIERPDWNLKAQTLLKELKNGEGT